jgi:GAF domain-containing protein
MKSFDSTLPLSAQLRLLLEGERDWLANAANAAALIGAGLPGLNWAGFYFLRRGELVLGPFSGRPACVRISLDRGVCGRAARLRQTQVVADVQAFPGHIACDAATRSEIVVPLLKDGRLLGVLDLDSPEPDRFATLQAEVEALAAIYLEASDFSSLTLGDDR